MVIPGMGEVLHKYGSAHIISNVFSSHYKEITFWRTVGKCSQADVRSAMYTDCMASVRQFYFQLLSFAGLLVPIGAPAPVCPMWLRGL